MEEGGEEERTEFVQVTALKSEGEASNCAECGSSETAADCCEFGAVIGGASKIAELSSTHELQA